MDNDKMLDLVDNRDQWNHACHYCESKNLAIHPVGVSYRNVFEDVDDLPPEARVYYGNLPDVVEAVLVILKYPKLGRISMECIDCGNTWNGFWNERPNMVGNNDAKPNVRKLKSYLKQFYGIEDMLRLKVNE